VTGVRLHRHKVMSTRTFRGARLVRFGEFELDVKAAELRKNGQKVRIQEQPFRILSMLLERPGEAVLRDEIRKRLWPNDTVVEVGHGINAAVLRLRDALGESAEAPRFIDTLARRGYRFNGQVEVVYRDGAVTPAAPASAPAGEPEGRTVSHYRVLEKLGGGGMGVVYRAEDLTLGREVALKFLPPELAGDRAAADRFRREARAASSLNHPNVCTIYGVEECDSQPVIVMELIEGETLAARLEKGPLPLSEALTLAMQVAGALDEAHRRAVVHRDLKPSNLLVTRSGIKVLDFGLAKMARAAEAGLTGYGAIMGTPSYMSPEQVRGGETDGRSDIFSFGLVLYEMLTGRRALEHSSDGPEDREPRLAEGFAPAEVERVVRRCLARDAEERWQSARDLRAELEWIAAQLNRATAEPAARETRISWKPVAIGAACLLAAIGAWKWKPNEMTATAPTSAVPTPVRMTVPRAEPATSRPAISPDGKKMAYLSGGKLFVRKLEGGLAEEIPGSDGVGSPFWSPDSRSVAFASGGQLKRVELGSAVASVICVVNTNLSGTWGADGTILIGMLRDGIYRVPASGGVATRVTEVHRELGETRHLLPQFLPDGERFLYVAGATVAGKSQLYVGRLGSTERTAVLPLASTVVFVASREALIYLRDGMLMAQAFDATNLRVTGEPSVVAGPVMSVSAAGAEVAVGEFSAGAKVLAYRGAGSRGVTFLRGWGERL